MHISYAYFPIALFPIINVRFLETSPLFVRNLLLIISYAVSYHCAWLQLSRSDNCWEESVAHQNYMHKRHCTVPHNVRIFGAPIGQCEQRKFGNSHVYLYCFTRCYLHTIERTLRTAECSGLFLMCTIFLRCSNIFAVEE